MEGKHISLMTGDCVMRYKINAGNSDCKFWNILHSMRFCLIILFLWLHLNLIRSTIDMQTSILVLPFENRSMYILFMDDIQRVIRYHLVQYWF